jgi:hypothetical protein
VIGTITVAAMLLALVFTSRLEAAGPRLAVANTTLPGRVTVVGEGFAANAHVELLWHDSSAGMPSVTTDEDGHFGIVMSVPDDVTLGTHLLTAREHAGGAEPREAAVAIHVVMPPDHSGMAMGPADAIAAADPTSEPGEDPEQIVVPHAGHAMPSPSSAATPEPVAAVVTPVPAAAPPPHPAPPAPPADAHAGGHPPASGNPVTCSGYAEPRTFLEVHAWWEGAPLAAGQIAHVHAGTCFPLGQTVSGQVPFDVRIVMHDNPGHLYRYETALFTDGQGAEDVSVVDLDHRCATTCEFWVRTVVDTSGANDGWHEFRFKPRVRFSNGEVQLTSSGWPLRTENGNPDGGFRDTSDGPWLDIVGRGWYDGHGYQNPVLRSVDAVLPGNVVSGLWQPEVRLDAGSEGDPATFSAVYIDPDFHHNDEDSNGGGVVIGQWNGLQRGPVAIDTSRLSNGWHTLALRVDAQNGDSRLVGLQYIQIFVQN